MASEPRKPKKEVRVRQVPAVSRSIAILRLLGNTRQGMGVKAIADAHGGRVYCTAGNAGGSRFVIELPRQ